MPRTGPKTPIEIGPHGTRTSHTSQTQLSDFAVDFGRISSRISGGETHHIPSSSGQFIFGMPDMTTIFSLSIIDPHRGTSVVPRGTTIPFHADSFGSSHISPSTPFKGGFSYP